MKAVFFSFPAVLTILAAVSALSANPAPVLAQDADDPSIIRPDEAPPGTMPELPSPTVPGDEGPMVKPAPDADPEVPPEAFGGPLADEDEADEALTGIEELSTDLAEPSEKKPETLDTLFSDLKRTGDQKKARRIARKIEKRWHDSGSATIDLLMQRAAQAMGHKQTDTVLDLLDQTLILDPTYAEAWNRRATAHFQDGAYGKSIADIEQTLALEPRHWGALMGFALILERTDQKARALDVYKEVLAVYPALKSAQDAVGRLSEKLSGPAI